MKKRKYVRTGRYAKLITARAKTTTELREESPAQLSFNFETIKATDLITMTKKLPSGTEVIVTDGITTKKVWMPKGGQ